MNTCPSIINPIDTVTMENESITNQVGQLLYTNDDSVKSQAMRESARAIPYCVTRGDPHYHWTDEPLENNPSYEQTVQTVHSVYQAFTAINQSYIALVKKECTMYQRNSGKIILSLTTSPERLQTLHYVLACFYDDIKDLIDVIYVTLPWFFRNIQKRERQYTIPIALLDRFPLVKILGISYDNGPAAKIIHAVEYERQISDRNRCDESIFLSLDDDMDYRADYIYHVIYQQISKNKMNTKYVISPMATDINRYESFPLAIPALPKMFRHSYHIKELAQGFGIIGYKGKTLDPLFIKQVSNADRSCRLSDDVTISYQLGKDGIPIYRIESETNWVRGLPNFPWYKDPNALQAMDGTEIPRYNQCWKSVLQPLSKQLFTRTDDPNLLQLYNGLVSPDPDIRLAQVEETLDMYPELFNPNGSNLKTHFHTTALLESIYRNDERLFDFVIQKLGQLYGKEQIVNETDSLHHKGNKPLDVAVTFKNIHMIKTLLENGARGEEHYANRGSLTIQDRMDIYDLVASRSTEIQRLFLDYNKKVAGMTDLDKAIAMGFIELAYELVRTGGVFGKVEYEPLVRFMHQFSWDAMNDEGDGLYHIAAACNAGKVITTLFFKGIPLTQVNRSLQTILHLAAEQNNLSLLQTINELEIIKRNTQFIPDEERLYRKLDRNGKTAGMILYDKNIDNPYQDGLWLACIITNAHELVKVLFGDERWKSDPIRTGNGISIIERQQFSFVNQDRFIQLLAIYDREWFTRSLPTDAKKQAPYEKYKAMGLGQQEKPLGKKRKSNKKETRNKKRKTRK